MDAMFTEAEVVEDLKKTQKLLGELLETLDVLADKEALEAIDESRKDKAAGRIRPLGKFLAEHK